MERSWYRVHLHGGTYYAPLTALRAAELRAGGMELERTTAPEDLAERLAPLFCYMLETGYHADGD